MNFPVKGMNDELNTISLINLANLDLIVFYSYDYYDMK